MQYSEAKIGRVLIAHFVHDEDFVAGVSDFISDSGLSSALLYFMGALKDGEAVAGPIEAIIPPIPDWITFESAWEIVGLGTVFPSDEGPIVHLHASLGRSDGAYVGCLRTFASVYLIVEVIAIELVGSNAKRVYDPDSGHYLLEP